MKQFFIRLLSLISAACLMLGSFALVAAAPEPLVFTALYACADETHEDVRVSSQTVGASCYLFLPSNMTPDAAILHFELNVSDASVTAAGSLAAASIVSGEAIDLTALCGSGDTYRITLTAATDTQSVSTELTVVPTSGVASMYLISDDPVNNGREWVESSADKSNKATGSMLMSDTDGTVIYDGKLTQIKGRGNSTWLADKKPYQIKLKTKTDLLQTGETDNVSKTWVLLTNHADPSLLRNNIVYDLSVAMQIEPGIECRPVNLYYDGEYRGAYLLCEKVEINVGRIDITDLEESIEDANPDVDFDTLSVRSASTANGATYYYCEGLTTPENFSGGYLLEMESASRAQAEVCYFITTRGQSVVVKSPEYCSKEVMDYIAGWYQEYEDTVYNGGIHPSNGKTLSDYADIDSLAQCYIINELTKNPDGYRTSAYLYKDADTNVCKMGPVWDYDLSFGIGWGEFVDNCADPESFFTLRSKLGTALYQIPEFRQAVHDIYLNTVAPLIDHVLCADTTPEGSSLQAMPDYISELRSAANANAIIWGRSLSAWEANITALRSYIVSRNAWLTEQYSAWSAEGEPELLGYVDVFITDWYFDDIITATDYGILNGMDYGIFAPENNTTRAEATKVLYAISDADNIAYESLFPDVPGYEWYASAITWAGKNGVVTGYEDGTFRPEDNITREEFITLLYRYLDEPQVSSGTLSGFADASAVDSYAVKAMCWAIENGVVKGYEDNTLRPQANMTRAEMAALIVRFYEAFIRTDKTA